MAIYHFDKFKQEEIITGAPALEERPKQRSGLFASFITRLTFTFLLAADLIWLVYTIGQIIVVGALHCAFLGKKLRLHRAFSRAFLSLRRALVCAISLIIGLFCPSFGMMVACTYFMMYDKAGVEEVIPGPLQTQFRELFQ